MSSETDTATSIAVYKKQVTDNRCAWHLSIRECGISDEEYARLVLEAAE